MTSSIRGAFAEHSVSHDDFERWLTLCIRNINEVLALKKTVITHGIKNPPYGEHPSQLMDNKFEIDHTVIKRGDKHMWNIWINDRRPYPHPYTNKHLMNRGVIRFTKLGAGCLTGGPDLTPQSPNIHTSDVITRQRIIASLSERLKEQHMFDLVAHYCTPDTETKSIAFAQDVIRRAGIEIDNPNTFQGLHLPEVIPPYMQIS